MFEKVFVQTSLPEQRGALQRIETALHKLELSFLKALPTKYHALVPDGQPKIREIVVTENKPVDSQSQATLN